MKVNSRIGLFVLCMLINGLVNAAGNPLYVGVKGGLMISDISDLDSAVNAGVLVGYSFPVNEVGSFAVEGELTTSIVKGDAKILGTSGDWDLTTFAVYGVYRSEGDLYFKGKVGYLDEDVSINVAGFSSSATDSGSSVGLGVGMKMGTGALEVEYTVVEEDINFLSAGYNFSF